MEFCPPTFAFVLPSSSAMYKRCICVVQTLPRASPSIGSRYPDIQDAKTSHIQCRSLRDIEQANRRSTVQYCTGLLDCSVLRSDLLSFGVLVPPGSADGKLRIASATLGTRFLCVFYRPHLLGLQYMLCDHYFTSWAHTLSAT